MNRDDRLLLEKLMAAMADGDAAALFPFIEHFGTALAREVRRVLRELGRTDLLRDRDELDGLVQDAAIDLFRRAAGWDRTGALPWVWARSAIRSVVVRGIGHATVALDPDRFDLVERGPLAGGSDTPDIDYEALRARDADFELFCRAVDEVGSERDRRVFHEYLAQQANGDPSPSHTVGSQFGLTAENVRQIAKRMRDQLRRLIRVDNRYRALSERGCLAA